VALPVVAAPLRQRWRDRHQLRPTARWLIAIFLPYALCVAINPMGKLPGTIVRHLPWVPHGSATRGLVLVATGSAIWGLGTAIALAIARHRRIRLDDPVSSRPAVAEPSMDVAADSDRPG
jgi:hypothetical protein